MASHMELTAYDETMADVYDALGPNRLSSHVPPALFLFSGDSSAPLRFVDGAVSESWGMGSASTMAMPINTATTAGMLDAIHHNLTPLDEIPEYLDFDFDAELSSMAAEWPAPASTAVLSLAPPQQRSKPSKHPSKSSNSSSLMKSPSMWSSSSSRRPSAASKSSPQSPPTSAASSSSGTYSKSKSKSSSLPRTSTTAASTTSPTSYLSPPPLPTPAGLSPASTPPPPATSPTSARASISTVQRERNRLAAGRCRAHSRRSTDTLLETEQSIRRANTEFKRRAEELKCEVLALRHEILRQGECGCALIRNYMLCSARAFVMQSGSSGGAAAMVHEGHNALYGRSGSDAAAAQMPDLEEHGEKEDGLDESMIKLDDDDV